MMERTSCYTERIQLFRQIGHTLDEQRSELNHILDLFIQGNTQALQQLHSQASQEKFR